MPQLTGAELIAQERNKGFNNLKEEDFASDFDIINSGVQYAYSKKSGLRMELLIKAGALIAAEIDRLQNNNNGKED